MKRLLLIVAVGVLVAIAAADTAKAVGALDYPGAVREPSLEAKLPTRVSVFCTRNTNMSFAYPEGQEMYLDIPDCEALLLSLKQPVPYPATMHITFWRAAHTLYHEWWHNAFPDASEQQTECGTYAIYRYALVRYWDVSPRVAQQDYLFAWQWSPYAPLPCVA